MEAYIRQAAAARGIDPDTAVRVAKSEGLAPGVWQAKANLSYGRERSYGPFQLHVAPDGFRQGMGNDFVRATGLDPADPRNWRQGVDFALTQAKRGGWGPWFGAKKIGVTGKMGIDGNPVAAAPQGPRQPSMGSAMGGFAAGPGAVAARQFQEGTTAPPAPSMADYMPELPTSPWSLGGALAGMVDGGMASRQVQPQVATQPQPMPDFMQMMDSLSQPGRALVEDQRKQFALPEVGSLADILGGAATAGLLPD
jgi:hypothetical protein